MEACSGSSVIRILNRFMGSGSGRKAAVKFYYNRSVSFGMQGECPAYRQNYADLDPTYRDTYGNPLIRITFNFTDNERRMVRYVAEQALTPILAQMNPAVQQVADTITDLQSDRDSRRARLSYR